MATTKKTDTPAERSRQRYAEAKAKVDTIYAEQDRVTAALDELVWSLGESTLPLIDLERQRDMLDARAKVADKALTRAGQNLWPTDQPDVAIAIAALLDGQFLDGAPAKAYHSDPDEQAELPQFRVVQSQPHQIDASGGVVGEVKISIVGPAWAQTFIDSSNKIAIIDHLHYAGVQYLNASGSRELKNHWRESLTVKVRAHGPAPYVSPGAPSGQIDAQVTGGWEWRRFARRDPGAGNPLPYTPDVLEGGRQLITVTDSKLDGNVRTTNLDIAVTVYQPSERGAAETAKAAVEAMAGRGIVAGVGRIQSVEITGVKPYERPIDAGQRVIRGFTVHAKATAVGTVR